MGQDLSSEEVMKYAILFAVVCWAWLFIRSTTEGQENCQRVMSAATCQELLR